jgi:aspartyl-tRNA(Asn)/glutamyl-tRNA(Gln) amidotransferase subunit A
MTKLDVRTTNIVELSRRIKTKEVSPIEVIEAFLHRVAAVQPKINAFITVLEREARQAAKEAEREIVKGSYRGPLHGIPVAVKDLYLTAGIRTTCGSAILADFIPDSSGAVIERLEAAGAILIGKTNMHEFAFGPTNLNPHYGHVRNPWDLERMSGGSSGGSAAAIAASCALLGLGTDTGGSIRIPSVLCATVGLKPTFGRVSKRGVYPLAWSLDHAGPITRTVADAALALGAIAGYDPQDPQCQDLPVPDYLGSLTGDVQGVRIGIPDSYFFEQIDSEVEETVTKAIGALRDLGAEVRTVHIPDLDKTATATLLTLSSEAATCLEEFHRTRPSEIGEDVRARLDLGATHLATHYLKAQRVRRAAQESFARVLSEVDVLATPGLSITAPRLQETTVRLGGQDVAVVPALTRCTRLYNLLGIPAVAIPIGFSMSGLPIGLQVAGKPFDECTILRVADAYERHIFRVAHWPSLA